MCKSGLFQILQSANLDIRNISEINDEISVTFIARMKHIRIHLPLNEKIRML